MILFEQNINLEDYIKTGIAVDAYVTNQLLINIFEHNTPLHDGAVIISNNKIAAAACILPLAGDNDIAKEIGTNPTTFSEWINGNKEPQMKSAVALADYFNVSLDYLFGRSVLAA